MNRSTRRLVLSAAFAGLAVALGYALAQFPNIELMTATLERIRGQALVSPMEWLDY